MKLQRRWRAAGSWIGIVAVAAPLALTGCAQLVTQARVRMFCEPTSEGIESALVLMVQAVPSASVVPCINVYPPGWTLSAFDAKTDRVEITFDSDRGGVQALVVGLAPSCRSSGSTLPPDEVGAPRLRQAVAITRTTFRATRYYTFPGGCMTFRFDVPLKNATALTSDAVLMIHLKARAKVEAELARLGFQP